MLTAEVSPVQPPATERLWNDILSNHIGKLNRKERALMTESEYKLTYTRVMETVDRVASNTRKKRLNICLQAIKPILTNLKVFSGGITTMSQAQANPACLIWGGIEILLTVAFRYMSTIETMLNTLGSLTTCITRLNKYIELLPNQQALQACMRLVCDEYIKFCISAILFYDKIRWHTWVWFALKTVNEKFQEAKAKIDGLVHQFEMEARLEIDHITVRGIQSLQRAPSTRPVNSPAPVFKVDFGQNKFFTGREKELSFLCELIRRAKKDSERGICTIHSMGGVGKTQLALEYAYRFRAEFDCVFWLPAEYGPRLAQAFADIWKAITGEADPTGQDASSLSTALSENLAAAVMRTKEWLRATDRHWLLIYDNVDDWDTIRPYWPSGNTGTILITSQRSDLVQISGGCEIQLSTLPPQEGGALLMKHLRKMPLNSPRDLKVAVSIASTVGGLPVAISHIAGYIEKSQSTLAEFEEIYASRAESHRIWSQDCQSWTHQYHQTLETTWDIALHELPAKSRALLNIFAMLDAESISEELLSSSPNFKLDPDSIKSLGARQLARRQFSSGRQFWSIHRALQQSLLHRLDKEPSARQDAFQLAYSMVRRAFPRQSDVQAPSNQNWLANEACLGHALHLEKVYETSPTTIKPPDGFAELLADVSNYMWERGLYERGIITGQLAKRIHKESERTRSHDLIEHSKVCTSLCGIYLELGISGRKEGLAEALEAWELRRQFCAQLSSTADEMTQENLLLVANSWNDIACCMMEYGCYETAESWLSKSIELKRDLPEHGIAFFNFAENFKNLAILRTAQGRTAEAVALSRKAVLLVEKHNSLESAVAQSFKFHLAYALYQAGNYQEALSLHEEVRQTRVRIFGPQNIHTLNSYYGCAVALQALGKTGKAEDLLTYCLEGQVSNTWTLDYVARIKYRLAMLWQRRNHRPGDSSALLQDARLIREQHFKYFRPFQVVVDGLESEEMVVYDHMIPIEGGRGTVGQLRVSICEIPEVAHVVVDSDPDGFRGALPYLPGGAPKRPKARFVTGQEPPQPYATLHLLSA